MLARSIKGDRQLINKEIDFWPFSDKGRCHDHRISSLTHHEALSNRRVASVHRRGRFGCQSLARGLILYQLNETKIGNNYSIDDI